QRLYLIWVFRHFETLPVKVLNSRQSRMIETMCANNQFVSLDLAVDYAPLLGTLEQRPPVPVVAASRRPVSSVRDSVGPFAADAQQSNASRRSAMRLSDNCAIYCYKTLRT